jgi:PAS domain S-box-containing protein
MNFDKLKIKVLLVDDDKKVLEVGKLFFEKQGMIVTTATSAAEAMELLEKEKKIDVVISDHSMTELSGIDFLKQLRAKKDRIPFVLFTGGGNQELVIEALNSGANFYFQKSDIVSGRFQELSEQIKAIVLTNKNEELCRLEKDIINRSNNPIFSFDDTLCYDFVNTAFAEGVGKTPEELIGKSPKDVFPSEDAALRLKTVIEVFRTGEGQELQVQVTTNGETRHYKTSANPFRDSTGKIIRVICISTDITEEQNIKKKLQKSEQKFRDIAELLPVGIFDMDLAGRLTYFNYLMAKMFAFSDQAFEEGIDAFGLIVEEDRQRAKDNVAKQIAAYETGQIYERGNVYKCLGQDNSSFVCKIYVSPILSHDKIVGFRGAVVDITEEEQSKEELRVVAERNRSLIENSHDIIYTFTLDGIITFVSPSWETVLGHPVEAVLGQSFTKFVHPEDVEHCQYLLSQMGRAGKSVDYRVLHADKTWRWHHTNASLLTNKNGEIVGFEGSAKDVTTFKKHADELLSLNKKLKILSHITRHDVSNQLMVINGYADLAFDLADNQIQLEYLTNIQSAIKKVNRHLQFSKEYDEIGSGEPGFMRMSDIISESSKILSVENNCKGLLIYADPMVKKVFYNLQDNTERHGEKATKITISCQKSEKGITIIWEDNGVGVPDEKKEKIFKPGFGTNTGMGLFLIREILAITDITIRETGRPGEGAKFEIFVPNRSYTIEEDK